MSRRLARTLNTDMGLPLKHAAKALASKGRGNDTMLAHVTPREMALLKARGGSGTVNPDTGLIEFDDSGFEDYSFDIPDINQVESASQQPIDVAPTVYTSPSSGNSSGGGVNADAFSYGGTPAASAPSLDYSAPTMTGPGGISSLPSSSSVSPILSNNPSPSSTAPEKSFLDKLTSWDTLKTVGAAAIPGALGVISGNRANKQAKNLQEQQAALGRPYQQAGQQMISAANAGDLTPANQQALQAASAQLHQNVASSGGVGAQQAAQQIATIRALLLQGQLDYGMKLAGIGDQIVAGAIKSGWQADQYAQQLQGDYFQAMARILGGTQGAK